MIESLKIDFLKFINSKHIFYESLLILLFCFALISSSISNYSKLTLIIKTLFSFILVLYYFFLQMHIYKQRLHFSFQPTIKLILGSLLFIIITFYSLLIGGFNTLGLQKFYLLLVQVIPITLVIYFAASTWNENRAKALFIVTISIGVVASVISLFLSPFNPFIIYNFSFTRWSHVAFGRFIVIPIILTFYLVYLTNNKKLIPLYFALAAMMVITLISSGFRAGVIAIITFLFSLLIYSIISNKVNFFKLQNLLLAGFLLASPIIIIYTQQTNLVNRLDGFEQIATGESIEDGSLTSRLKAYEIAWNGGWKKPIFGHGLGTFQFADGNFTAAMKYPHNIFLEFFYEFGMIGVLIFIYVFILSLYYLLRTNFWLISLYLVFFWFSLFSKDIPSNVMVFSGLSLIGLTDKKKAAY